MITGKVVIPLRPRLLIVSCGCRNKLPPIWWLKTTGIYFLIVMNARSPFKGSRTGESFLAPSSFWGFEVFLGSWLHHFNPCLHLHMAFSGYLSFLLALIRTFVIGQKSHSNPG